MSSERRTLITISDYDVFVCLSTSEVLFCYEIFMIFTQWTYPTYLKKDSDSFNAPPEHGFNNAYLQNV